MHKLKATIPDIPVTVEYAVGQVLQGVTAAVEKTAQEVQSAWQAGIMKTSGVWLDYKKSAVASIQFQMQSYSSAEVFSEARSAIRIEEGFPERDLKLMLQTSKKTRATKAGKKYLIIPFRHNVPGSTALAPAMPKNVYAKAKLLSPSSVVGKTTRVSATGHVIPQSKYQWGSSLPTGMAPRKKPQHASDIYTGMKRFDTSSGKAKSSSYLTFRVMMEGASKWLVPAKPGHYVLKSLSVAMQPRLEKNLRDAIAAVLS